MTLADRSSSPRQAPQLSLENRHFFVTVHPLNLEDRFGVDLADRTGRGEGRGGTWHLGLSAGARPEPWDGQSPPGHSLARVAKPAERGA